MPLLPPVRVGHEVVLLDRYLIPIGIGAVFLILSAVLAAVGAAAWLVITLLAIDLVIIGVVFFRLSAVLRRSRRSG